MKILVIGSVYPRFDQDSEVPWLRTSLRHLQASGGEVRVLAPAYQGLKDHCIDQIPVYRFRYAPASWEILTHDEGAPSKMAARPWMQLLAIPYIISGFFRCLWLAKKWKPTLIHAHWPFPHGLIALGACKLFKIPLVLNFHGAELLLIRKHPWVRSVLHFILGQSSLVFANSHFTAQKIQAIRPVTVEISPYGTTLGTTPERPLNTGTPFRVLFVGRHIERKGIEFLLQAAALLPTHSFEFRIVGHGDRTPALQHMATQMGLSHVHFTGKLSASDLEQEYQQAHAFVLPAIVDSKGDTEGLGVVLIEAAEYGLVLVASEVGGIPDVVIHGQSGYLVPPANPQKLAEALQHLQAHPEQVQQLVAGARQHIQQNFSWDAIIQKQIKAYQSLT